MVEYLVYLTISAGLFSLFALGLNLQWGFTGLINFGHVAFLALGAYSTALLSSQGIPIPIAVCIGAALAALLGLAIGTSTLRLREDYLAIVTIGVSELVRLVALNEEWLTKGSFGVRGFGLPFDRYEPDVVGKVLMAMALSAVAIFAFWQIWRGMKGKLQEYQQVKNKSYQPTKPIGVIIWGVIGLVLILTAYINTLIALGNNFTYKVGLAILVLIVLGLVYWGLDILIQSPWGRVLKAIREDEEIPKALGKNVFWYKLQAFMLGGAIAGIAGAFYAWQITTIYPDNFIPNVTFNAWTVVVLGGAGSNPGTLLGVIIFYSYETLTNFLSDLGIIDSDQVGNITGMLIGLILMIIMIWRPQGVLGKKEELTLGR
jgi:neutral amino acid transport system permease protein